MRCWHLLLALSAGASAYQIPLSTPPSSFTTNLIDALSKDPDYSVLLKLLQRARLIPTINRFENATIFAPTNDAIKRHDSFWNSVYLDDSDLVDNVHEQLRQELFYHLLNYTVSELPKDDKADPVYVKTLHYPKVHVDPPTDEPPPHPPWMPIPHGLLGDEPQRLRLAAREGNTWVGVDAFGNGGAKVVAEPVKTANGFLVKIEDVLNVPVDIANTLSQYPAVSYFNDVLTPETTKLLNTTSELTLFLPANDAWEKLDKLERLYLESGWATDDLQKIVRMHAVAAKGVKWTDKLNSGDKLETISGTELNVSIDSGKTTISHASIVQPDIYASNGVIHFISELIIPPGSIELTPEKYLLALNCSKFVSLMHSVNLTHFINDTSAEYTILAPQDDVISVFGGDGLPKEGSKQLEKVLRYHIIPGSWTPGRLEGKTLLETALLEEGLDGGKQVLHVDVTDGKHIRFGGAGVLRDPITVNKTTIYFISRPLSPPVDALDTILPELDLSSFLAAIFSTSLADILRKQPRTSILVPHNDAFKRLGMLVSDYLLSSSSKAELEHLILHHVIDGVEYADALTKGSQRTFPTLEGTDIQLHRSQHNATITVSPSGGWAHMLSALTPTERLTQTGVVHELSDILLPRSVDITLGKLAKSAKGSTMAGLVTKAGLDWILNGTAPPEGSPWADADLPADGWTLLCPTDDAFKGYNLTDLHADIPALTVLVAQHIVWSTPSPKTQSASYLIVDALNNNRPLSLDSQQAYRTILSQSHEYGDIVFRPSDTPSELGSYVVGIKGARGTSGDKDWARVLAWGRATTGSGKGGVIQIDRVLAPYYPPWWLKYGAPVLVGILGGVGICFFFAGVRWVWRKDMREATYEPVGGFSREEMDE